MTDCLFAASLPQKIDLGAVNKNPFRRTRETLLNGPDSSTSDGCCNLSFTNFCEAAMSCTIAGETRRKSYQSHSREA